MNTRINPRGNTVESGFNGGTDRYVFDDDSGDLLTKGFVASIKDRHVFSKNYKDAIGKL